MLKKNKDLKKFLKRFTKQRNVAELNVLRSQVPNAPIQLLNEVAEIENVFSNVEKKLGSWATPYKSFFKSKNAKLMWHRLQQHLQNEATMGRAIYPQRELWFLAYRLTPPHRVKVVILGQDPYPGTYAGFQKSNTSIEKNYLTSDVSVKNFSHDYNVSIDENNIGEQKLKRVALQQSLCLRYGAIVDSAQRDSVQSLQIAMPHAHGLSFSSLVDEKLPASLRNIYLEILRDIPFKKKLQKMQRNYNCDQTHVEGKKNSQGGLLSLANQGVFLLNTVLTTQAGKPGAHSNFGWQNFTMHAIQHIATQKKPVVFMLWGAAAKRYLPDITKALNKKISSKLVDCEPRLNHNEMPALRNMPRGCAAYSFANILVLTAPHPSPLSVYRGFSGCGHFSAANNFLLKGGEQPIDWHAPIKNYCKNSPSGFKRLLLK